MKAAKESVLSALLADAFDGDAAGLLRWIRLSFGKEIHHELPNAPSLAELAFQSMLVFQRSGRIDHALFEGLLALRPGLGSRIRDVARLWGIELADAEPSSPASAADGSILGLPSHLPHLSRLESLLESLFTPQEAHEWLTSIISLSAKGGAPPNLLILPSSPIKEGIFALHRRGLLGAEFFRALAAERPRRIADIKLTECWWLGRPKHFRLSPYMRIRGDFAVEDMSTPESCLSFQLTSTITWDQFNSGNWATGKDEVLFESDGVIFDMDAYPEPSMLLEDLYAHYLRNRFPPLTYGKTWIVVQGSQAVVPWEWVVEHRAPEYRFPLSWLMDIHYADFGITRGSHLEVIDLSQGGSHWGVRGIATNSSELHSLLCSGSKLSWRLIDSDLVADVSPASILSSDFQYFSVDVCSISNLMRLPRHGAYVQTRSVSPEEQAFLTRWSKNLAAMRDRIQAR